MISEANKAASNVGPLLRSNSLAKYHRDQMRVDSEEEEEEEEGEQGDENESDGDDKVMLRAGEYGRRVDVIARC